MVTSTALFDYPLPPERIAQHSVEPRDTARMLVLDRDSGARRHLQVFDLPRMLRPGDLLVFNNTKVFKARLLATVRGVGQELFLLRCLGGDGATSTWEALMKKSRRCAVGESFLVGTLSVMTRSKEDTTGVMTLVFDASQEEVLAYCDREGSIPIPGYVKAGPAELSEYQTVYADAVGSVAAPTAGFHFTKRLLDELDAMGVERAFVTLHVGIGTFQPVRTETLEEHEMHREWVDLSEETVQAILRAKQEGRRVIAVGTTTVRVLEGVTKQQGALQAFSGDVNLFIKPGFSFEVIDGLLTNFHLPKSTLLALVSAFGGYEYVRAAYEEAIEKEYRFYSFGDAMLIL